MNKVLSTFIFFLMFAAGTVASADVEWKDFPSDPFWIVKAVPGTAGAASFPVTFPDGTTIQQTDRLELYYRASSYTDYPQVCVFLNQGWARLTSFNQDFWSSFSFFSFFSNIDHLLDRLQPEYIKVLGVTTDGRLILKFKYNVTEGADHFIIEGTALLDPPSLTPVRASMVIDYQITNAGVTLGPGWIGHHLFGEFVSFIFMSSMYQADELTSAVPSDFDTRYLGIVNDSSFANDAFSLVQGKYIPAHDVKSISSEGWEVVLSRTGSATLLPGYEWYHHLRGVDLPAGNFIDLKSADFFPTRRHRIEILGASGLVDMADLKASILLNMDHPEEGVDGDNVRVRVNPPQTVSTWPAGVTQRLTVRITAGQPWPLGTPYSTQFSVATFAPTDLGSFGSVEVGTTTSKSIVLRNAGNVDMAASISIAGTDASQFSVNASSLTIGPDGSSTITVCFNPSGSAGAGNRSATLTLNTNGGSKVYTLSGFAQVTPPPSQPTVSVPPPPLQPTVTDPPVSDPPPSNPPSVPPQTPPCLISVNTKVLDFGEVSLGDTAQRELAVENTGGPGVVRIYVLWGKNNAFFSLQPVVFSLGAGETKRITVTCSPTAEAVADALVQFDSGATIQEISLSAKGIVPGTASIQDTATVVHVDTTAFSPPTPDTAPAEVLSADKTAIDLGAVRVGKSISITTKIRNLSSQSRTIAVSMGGPDSSEFRITPFSLTLAPGNEQALTISWRPKRAGKRVDKVIVTEGRNTLLALPVRGTAIGLVTTGTKVTRPKARKVVALEIEGEGVARFELGPNYPNPFNPETTIGYQLPAAAQVRLEIYNVLGQKVRTLVRQVEPAGQHTVAWDGLDEEGIPLAGGVYFCRLELEADSKVLTRRLMLLK